MRSKERFEVRHTTRAMEAVQRKTVKELCSDGELSGDETDVDCGVRLWMHLMSFETWIYCNVGQLHHGTAFLSSAKKDASEM